jgi:hypothetical protein
MARLFKQQRKPRRRRRRVERGMGREKEKQFVPSLPLPQTAIAAAPKR